MAEALARTHAGTVHVHECGLGSVADTMVWEHARKVGLVVVTKDSDFEELSVLKGPPPKVIWLRTGNCTTAALIALFRRHETEIARFVASETDAILEIR